MFQRVPVNFIVMSQNADTEFHLLQNSKFKIQCIKIRVFQEHVLSKNNLPLRPRSHYSVFVSIRFCCIEATVHTAPFLYKNGEKNLRFCAFTLICPITKTQQKTSVFVRSHCSVFVKSIVAYWSVFKKPPFLCVHNDRMRFQKPPFLWISTFESVFEKLRFCGVFVRISVNTFTKTEVFSPFLYKNGVV